MYTSETSMQIGGKASQGFLEVLVDEVKGVINHVLLISRHRKEDSCLRGQNAHNS